MITVLIYTYIYIIMFRFGFILKYCNYHDPLKCQEITESPSTMYAGLQHPQG